jgi:hypothetical protein
MDAASVLGPWMRRSEPVSGRATGLEPASARPAELLAPALRLALLEALAWVWRRAAALESAPAWASVSRVAPASA